MTTESPRFLDFNNPTNPYRLDHGDNPSLPLVPDLLTIENYTTWSRAMCRALRAKNKLGFIDGTFSKPKDPKDPLHEAWERCNDLVVSWLHNSINPAFKSSIALVDDAQQIWNELKDRFTQQNGHRIFHLKKALTGLQQDSDSVNTYFGKLKTLWDELLIYEPMPACTCGQLAVLIDHYQRDCVIQFLMGLNATYNVTRDQIMLMDPLPPINKIFSMIQQQEIQHSMLSSLPSPDSMALAIKQPHFNYKSFSKTSQPPKRDRPYCSYCKISGHLLDNCFKAGNAQPPTCTHCHMTGHIAEKCYKKHGYPPGHKLHDKNKPYHHTSANMTSLEPDSSPENTLTFTKDQYQQILSLLQSREATIANHSINTAMTDCNSSPAMNGPFVMDHDWHG
ncbi:uncharacterized protein LOC118343975 [Juglans regia]|uniref:Uncharacterized protein LOC118343975 n=1 Tax=Juglans regia TaxID=51240 RepID=A0A6P9DVZ9_JUGRE|nr:uncharacterized protein LOC118343975 [Juglans regia]